MRADLFGAFGAQREIRVTLDGLPVQIPSERRSLNAVRAFLEALALQHQRVLCSMNVADEAADVAGQLTPAGIYCRVEAKTIPLNQTPVLLLQTAKQQTALALEQVKSALTLVLINDSHIARELWWNLTRELKEPVLTLSLLPEDILGAPQGCASFAQLRKWQLQQIATIVKEVDEASESDDTIQLSTALEDRVLPWLQSLHELIHLWHANVLADERRRQAA